MSHIRRTALGAALAGALLIACRDAPTAPATASDATAVPSFSGDSGDAAKLAKIISAYTRVDFYDGSHGGEPVMEIQTGMVYWGNRATMSTNYSIVGAETSKHDRIVNQQDAFYNPILDKHFDETYFVPTGATCGLSLSADTQHQAWWYFWVRWFPNSETTRDIAFTQDGPLQLEPCEPPPPASPGGGGTSGGGYITIETCHYWAYYVNGVLVNIELRYCDYDTIPIADE
jgi:hypothetical protein